MAKEQAILFGPVQIAAQSNTVPEDILGQKVLDGKLLDLTLRESPPATPIWRRASIDRLI